MAFDDLFTLRPTDSPTRFTCECSALLLTPRRASLQGGAGLAATVLATERVAGRPTLWATAQYLSFAIGTDPMDVDVTIEVAGHATTQARCVLSRNGTEVLTTHTALGTRRFDGDRTFVSPPDVPPADRCEPYEFFRTGGGDIGDLLEIRLARGRQPGELRGLPGGNSIALWCRVDRERHVPGVGELAFIGDLLPITMMEPYGRRYAGGSIDNTIRVGVRAETEWVLLDCHLDQVANGFGYGQAYLWSDDGVLMATCSQTASARFLPDE